MKQTAWKRLCVSVQEKWTGRERSQDKLTLMCWDTDLSILGAHQLIRPISSEDFKWSIKYHREYTHKRCVRFTKEPFQVTGESVVCSFPSSLNLACIHLKLPVVSTWSKYTDLIFATKPQLYICESCCTHSSWTWADLICTRDTSYSSYKKKMHQLCLSASSVGI